ncbi:PREDICTED: titin-like [Ceratosolen solmsi marchali]|uniref:Titin-like n=1 Tax=Ceratosolen solmsi marchali TaxID=326594 RepID=A0AAJ6YDK8_9HYME|nr:PREDICTED: titin-like [Ceratosolen solmsi marchali]
MKIIPIQESLLIEVTPSMKKMDEKQRDTFSKQDEIAEKVIDEQQGIIISEIISEDTTSDFVVETNQAQVIPETFETIAVSEIYTESNIREIKKKKKKPEKSKITIKNEISEATAEKIMETQKQNIAQQVEEIMEVLNAPEFGPGEQPLRELATIGYLIQQGVTVNEINEILYRTDKFPTLKTPDAQNALVQLVERKGYGPIISQVLTEETTTDESIVAATIGFRALMKMVELQHATVEEVITNFTPEDFRPRAWEVTEVTEQIESEQTATERVEIIEQTEVHLMERKDDKTIVQSQDVQENKEYEDTRQAHITLRKRKDSIIEEQTQVDDTLQNREEGVEITIVEDLTTIKIKKDKKNTPKEQIEDETVETDDYKQTLETKRLLKTQRSKVRHEDLPFEEIEDLEITQDLKVSSLLINIASQQNEATSTNSAVDQAPIKPINEKAKINLDSSIALTEEYYEIQEKEIDRVVTQKPESRKASLTITATQSYSTSEIITQNETELFSDIFEPHPVKAASTILSTEGIIVNEVHTTEAKPINIDHKNDDVINEIEMTLSLQEAKIISETITNEQEVSTENYNIPNTVQAEKSVIPQQSITILEIQEDYKEGSFEKMKIIKSNPKILLNKIESIQIEEVYSEDKPSKYYPELIVPTEAALTSIVEQKQRFTEERLVSEKEGEYVPHKLPISQIADIEFSSAKEAVIIYEQSIQESENIYYPDAKVSTYEATPNVNLFESINVLSVNPQQEESKLTFEDIKLCEKIALVELTEARPGATTLEIITNDKEQLNNIEEIKPQDAVIKLNVSAHPIAIQSEILAVENIKDVHSDKVVTGIALPRREIHGELVVTEVNIAETEKLQEEYIYPKTQYAHMGYITSENLTINELNTVLSKEEDYKTKNLPTKQKVVPDIIKGHKVPEMEETFISNSTDILKAEAINPEIANLKQSSLEIAQTTEIIHSELEAPLPLNVESEQKTSGISFVEETSVEIIITNIEDKEGSLPEKNKPLAFEATINYNAQKAASTLEIISNNSLGDLSKDITIDIHPKTSLLPYQPTQIEEIQVQESEIPFPDIVLPNRTADVSFSIDESLTITTITASEKESDIETPEIIAKKNASTNFTAHPVAQANEIIPNNNIDYLKSKEIPITSAKMDHVLLNSIITSEVSPANTELSFLNIISCDKQQSTVVFEEEKSLQILETNVSEKEQKFVKEQDINLQTAEFSFDSHKIAESIEITPEIIPEHFINELPGSVFAKEQHTLFETVIQEETIPSCKEKLFTDKPIISNKANIEIEESIGISSITEIIPHNKEENLKDSERPNTTLVQVSFNGHRVAENIELNTYISSEIIEPQKPSLASAFKRTIPLEGLITEEIQINETEELLKDNKTPIKDTANTEIIAQKGLIVSSITLEDQEYPLNVKPIPDLKVANKLLTSEYLLPETTEHIVNQSSCKFKNEERTVTQNASSDVGNVLISLQTSIIESQIDVSETQTTKLEIARNAEIKQDIQEGLIITENVPAEMEQILDKVEKSITHQANIDIKNVQSLEISEITAQDKEETFFPKKSDEYSGVTNFIEHIPLSVSEVLSNEIEVTLPNIEKPMQQTATDKLLLTSKEIAETTEILTSIQTDIFESDKFPPKQSIQATSSKLSAILVSEIVADEIQRNLKCEDYPDKKIAVLNLTSQEMLQTTEVTAMSSLDTLKMDKIPLEETSTENIEETFSLEISQAISNEKESDFINSAIPIQQTARSTLLGREVAEISEIMPVMTVEKVLKVDILPEAIGKVKLDTLQPLEISEIMSNELEQPLSSSITPDTKAAQVNISGREIAETTEISPNITTDKLLNFEIPSHYIQKISIDTLNAAITTQTNSNDLEESISTITSSDITAIETSFIISNSIQTLEITTGNSLEELHQNIIPEEKKGIQGLNTMLPLTVSQVISNESENILNASEIPKSKMANPNLEGREIVESFETVTLNSTTDFEKPVLPDRIKGKEYIESLSLAVNMESICNESEMNISATEQPSEKNATSEIYGHEVVEIFETIPLHNFNQIQPKLAEEQTSVPQIDTLNTALISETIYNELEDDLKETRIPKSSIAHSQLLGIETTEITEVVTASGVDKLKEYNTPISQEALLDLGEITPICISEVVPNELESVISIDKIATASATEILKRQEVLETTEVIAVTNVQELPDAVVPETQISEEKPDIRSPLMTLEIQVNENSKAMKMNKIPEEISADVNVTTNDVAQCFEVVPMTHIQDYKLSEILEKQHGTPKLDTLSHLYVSQMIPTDTEINILNKNLPNEKFANSSIVSQEIPEISEIIALTNTEDLKGDLPDKQQGTQQIDTHTSLIICATTVNEQEKYLQSTEIPKQESANINLGNYTSKQVMEVITSTDTEDLSISKLSEIQLIDTSIQELLPITISETLLNEKEKLLPDSKPLHKRIVDINFEGQQVAETTHITTESSTKLLPENEIPEQQKATQNLNLLQPLTQTETLINQEEISLKDVEIPSQKIASVSIRGDEIAEITEIVPVSNVEVLTESLIKKSEIEKIEESTVQKPLKSTSVIEITCAEKEKSINIEKIDKVYHADITLDGQRAVQILETIPSISTKMIKSEALPECNIEFDQIPFESIQTDQIIIQESEKYFDIESPSSTAQAQITYKTSEGFETSEIFETQDKPAEIKTTLDKQVTAGIEITKTHVAVNTNTLSESSITEFTLNQPTSKTAKNIKDIQHSITVSEHNAGEIETNISEYPLPFPKKAEIILEVDRFKLAETTEASVQQHKITKTQIKQKHPMKQQFSTESDSEITEEYTTKFRRGSNEDNTAIKTKKTIIKKKKTNNEGVIIIEEEIDNVKSTLPSIPKKQFMQIEEVTGISDIEEITPTIIQEKEDTSENEYETRAKSTETEKLIITEEVTSKTHSPKIKVNSKETTKNRVIERKGPKQTVTEIVTVEEEGKTPVIIEKVLPEEEIVTEETTKPLTDTESVKPEEIEKVTETVSVKEEVTPPGKDKKTTKKRIIKRKGRKQSVTEIVTVEEEGKAPKTTILEQPEEEVISDETIEVFPAIKYEKPLESVETREQVTVTEEITHEGKPKKTTKKRVIKRRGSKQTVSETVTVEEEGKTPVIIEKVLPEEEIVTEETTNIPEEEIVSAEIITPITVGEIPKTFDVQNVADGRIQEYDSTKVKKPRTSKKKSSTEASINPDYIPAVLDCLPANTHRIPKSQKGQLDQPSRMADLKPIKIERKSVLPTKVTITQPSDLPQFPGLKLKKVVVPKRRESKSIKIPKIRLKSRIVFISDWPTPLQIPILTILEENPLQSGILSRNIDEAEKILKKKYKKKKLPGKDIIDLEELDKEFDDLKKKPLEKVDDLMPYEKRKKTPKDQPSEEDKKLKLGKGKIPKDDSVPEDIHLKKVPEKKEISVDKKEKKPKLIDEPMDVDKEKEDKPETTIQPLDFKPSDVDNVDLEKYEPEEKEKPTDESPERPREKYKRPDKKKKDQEIDHIPILKGEPKPKKLEDDTDVKFRVPVQDKPDEIPEEILLKPWTKEKPKDEDNTDIDTNMQLKPFEPIHHGEKDETKKSLKKKRKPVIKKSSIDETPDTQKGEYMESLNANTSIPLPNEYEIPESCEKVIDQITAIQNISPDGENVITTKRKVTKQKGKKQIVTETVTIEEQGKSPISIVEKYPEELITYETYPLLNIKHKVPKLIEEITEIVTVIEELSPEGKKKKTTKKRVTKRKGNKQSIINEVVTVEEEGITPLIIGNIPQEETIISETTTLIPAIPYERPDVTTELVEQITVINEQPVIETVKIEEVGKQPIIFINEVPQVDIDFDEETGLLAEVENDKPIEKEKVTEQITVAQEITPEDNHD